MWFSQALKGLCVQCVPTVIKINNTIFASISLAYAESGDSRCVGCPTLRYSVVVVFTLECMRSSHLSARVVWRWLLWRCVFFMTLLMLCLSYGLQAECKQELWYRRHVQGDTQALWYILVM